MTEISDRLRLELAGRYTIERQLGQGGMATVYLARVKAIGMRGCMVSSRRDGRRELRDLARPSLE